MAKTENPEEALQILISETSPNHIYYFLLPLSSLTYQPLISNHTTEERDQIILWKSRVAHMQRKGIIAPTITKSIYHSHDTIFKLMVIK